MSSFIFIEQNIFGNQIIIYLTTHSRDTIFSLKYLLTLITRSICMSNGVLALILFSADIGRLNSYTFSLSRGQWFSQGTPVTSNNKTDRNDVTEIKLKVSLSTITETYNFSFFMIHFCTQVHDKYQSIHYSYIVAIIFIVVCNGVHEEHLKLPNATEKIDRIVTASCFEVQIFSIA